MKIAVACNSDLTETTGHAGRAKHWLLFDSETADPAQEIHLAKDEVFHYFEGLGEEGNDHPLRNVNVIIAQSAGEGFLNKMKKRGIDAAMTAETDPLKAVDDYLSQQLLPPKPRPIGQLVCKVVDMFSKHKS